MKIQAVGIAWYESAESYAACLTIFQDAANLPETYEEWLSKAELLRAEHERAGHVVVKAIIDPVEFVGWCRANLTSCDQHGRVLFANVKARDKAMGG